MSTRGKRRVMILGAGIYQVPLIRKARSMGLETIVVSYPGNYPGFAEADRVVYADTTDAPSVLEAARSEQIDGILTTGTDVAVKTIGLVCDTLGLPGISEDCARKLTDKADMKAAFQQGGVKTSAFYRVSSYDDAISASNHIGYPLMVKACDVSGSRGVTKVSSSTELDAALESAYAASHVDHIVIEGFVEGHEIGVDGFAVDGELKLFAPHDKFVYHAGNVTIPAGHAFPLNVSTETYELIREETKRAIRATGFTSGAINADVMLTSTNEVSFIEMGGRCGATCIPELISCYTGIDYYAQMILTALGEQTDFQHVEPPVPCMAKLLFSDYACRVKSIDFDQIHRIEQEELALITIDVHAGDRIEAVQNGTSRFGSVLVPTDSEEELDRVLTRIRSCLRTRPE